MPCFKHEGPIEYNEVLRATDMFREEYIHNYHSLITHSKPDIWIAFRVHTLKLYHGIS